MGFTVTGVTVFKNITLDRQNKWKVDDGELKRHDNVAAQSEFL